MRDRERDDENDPDQRAGHGSTRYQRAILKSISDKAVSPARDNYHCSAGNAVEQTLLGCVSESHDQLAEKVGESAVWYIRENPVGNQSPG